MKDKKRFIIESIMISIISAIIPIVSQMLIDIIEVYKLNFSNIPEGFIRSHINIGSYVSFIKFDNPIKFLGIAIVGGIILITILNNVVSFKADDNYEMIDEYGSHGTSRWQTRKEIIKTYYGDKQGWFLGSVDKNKCYEIGMNGAYHPVNGELNMQTIVVGPPGSNKTTGFVLNNIFNLVDCYKDKNEKADIIITDPKSELFSLTAEYLKKNNYEVVVLDFINLEYGDCINPIDFINDDKRLMEIAHGYIESVGDGASRGEDGNFWNGQEAQLLAALIGFVKKVYDKKDQNLYNVSKLLTSEAVNNIECSRNLFKDHNVGGASEQLWNNFLMLSENERTRANIVGGLAEKLKLFAIEGIAKITSKTTIDITKLGMRRKKPTALFILMPDGDRTFSPIINVIISTLLKQLYSNAYKTKNVLEYPVYTIWEEMANIGKIKGIEEMLGTMRGRRIYPLMIWQSLSQMKNRYGEKGFEDIMSMCDTHVYLGINDMFTAKYCSESVGNTTIKVQGISKEAKGIFNVDSKSENKTFQQRRLIMEDESQRLDRRKMIIKQISRNPVILNKVQYRYWENPFCKYTDIHDTKKLDSYAPKSVNIITSKTNTIENSYIDDSEIKSIFDEIEL